MATPTSLPATFVAGNILTAAQMNNLRGAFRVLQIVTATKTDTFTMTSATYSDVTGLSVSITPSATSSTILLLASISGTASSDTQGFAQFVRGSTAIGVGDAAGSRVRATFPIYIQSNAFNAYSLNASFIDSPATTSATTYKIQVRREAATGTIFINRSPNDSDSAAGGRFISTLTAMEISA